MRVTSLKQTRQRASRLQHRLKEQAVKKQIEAFNRLVEAGIGLVKYWALAGDIEEDHIAILSALLAFTDSSYYSDKPRKAKTDALGLALRAAYLYGKFGGVAPHEPQPETETEPQDGQ